MITVKDYVDTQGQYCPRCQSEQIEGDRPDFGNGEASERMYCLDCELVWLDCYQLVRYEVFS